MEKKNFCNICYKKFTLRWNLERHLYDIHEVQDEQRKARIKQEIDVSDHLSNMVKPKCKILDKDNNMNQTQYNQSYYNNNNNLPNNLSYYYYGY